MKSRLFSLVLIVLLLASCTSPITSQPDSASTDQPTGSSTAVDGGTGNTKLTTTSTLLAYPLVDTSQGKCYDNQSEVPCATLSINFYGQDAQYAGNQAQYQDNGDGTVTDLVTGLMWQQDPGAKVTYDEAAAGAASFNLAGYADWRLPTIKELYSLILFDGTDVSGCPTGSTCDAIPFIDTRYFYFSYGDAGAGERTIDSQFATSTKYVSTTMNSNETMFGVNFADGRIKGYGTNRLNGGGEKKFYVLYVRGNAAYGQNSFVDNGDGTVTDNATGLMWMQSDGGRGMNWSDALAYCEALDFAGVTDWRLPNVKELQSIADYSRSPDTTSTAAIDPVFHVTAITNEAGQTDYPFFWSSTTHADMSGGGRFAAYVSFGRALGYMNSWMDVHGAGAQRSDPKTGSGSDYPQGHGPQGDAVRVMNYARCVRGGNVTVTAGGNVDSTRPAMQVESTGIQQSQNDGAQDQLRGAPPQEAVTACATSTMGAACSFITPNGVISGTCQWVQQQLACVPAAHP